MSLEPLICLENEAMRVCVSPQLGGRIVEFSRAGRNALVTRGPATGSTFWPSPQSVWDWPPLAALDEQAYSSEYSATEARLCSQVCEQTALQVIKRFMLRPQRLDILYTMRNTGSTACQFAPWEITRVGGGTTFYRSSIAPLAISTGAMQREFDCYWHEYEVTAQVGNEKIFGNGSAGWLANAYQGLLLLKRFAPVQAANTAPGEAEIEIYGHGDPAEPYIEVEQQGEYQVIAAGEQIQWSVTWYLQQIPAALQARSELLEMVNSLLQDDDKQGL